MSHGPNLDFDGPLTIELHAQPLAQAQAAYDAHMARKVEYDYRLPFNHPHNEAARKWADQLYGEHGFKTALDIAKACGGSKIKLKPASQRPTKPRCDRQGAQHFIDKTAALIREMAKHDVMSDEWEKLRSRASACRATAVGRAKADGVQVEIPEVPKRGRGGLMGSLKHYLKRIDELMGQIAEVEPMSLKWWGLRNRLKTARSHARSFAKAAGVKVSIPDLPKVVEQLG